MNPSGAIPLRLGRSVLPVNAGLNLRYEEDGKYIRLVLPVYAGLNLYDSCAPLTLGSVLPVYAGLNLNGGRP